LDVFFDVFEDFPSARYPGIIATVFARDRLWIEIKIGAPKNLGQTLRYGLQEALISKRKPACQILAEDIERQCFDQRVVQGLLVTQLLIGADSLRYVAENYHPAALGARFVSQRP